VLPPQKPEAERCACVRKGVRVFFRKHSYTCTKLFDLHNE